MNGELIVLAGSAGVVALMVGAAWALGFRQSGRLDLEKLETLAASEGARVVEAAISADGRAGLAKLGDGRLLAVRVVGEDVSARLFAQGQAKISLSADRVSALFADLGYPRLDLRLGEIPAWLEELAARR